MYSWNLINEADVVDLRNFSVLVWLERQRQASTQIVLGITANHENAD